MGAPFGRIDRTCAENVGRSPVESSTETSRIAMGTSVREHRIMDPKVACHWSSPRGAWTEMLPLSPMSPGEAPKGPEPSVRILCTPVVSVPSEGGAAQAAKTVRHKAAAKPAGRML